MQRIYLDHNATTPMLPQVLEAMLPYWNRVGNPSSMHREGQAARRAVESARETIAALLDTQPDQVIFTSGGTESNNVAILGLAGDPPARVLISSIEHPSVSGCASLLERRGFEVVRVPVDSYGIVSPSRFADLLTPATRLASIMLVNNETGAIQPIAQMAALARDRNVLFHTDAAQAVGKIPTSFRSLGVHALSLSAHKFCGPPGIGAVLVDRKEPLQPVLTGGHQEMGLRPGTEAVALIVGMAKALELVAADQSEESARCRQLCDYLVQKLRDRIAPLQTNGPIHERVPNTLNVRFPGADAQAAVLALDLLGVACSTGSACASGAPTPSATLLAMGLTESEARASLRFSLGRSTTRGELDNAIEAISQVIAKQRQSKVEQLE